MNDTQIREMKEKIIRLENKNERLHDIYNTQYLELEACRKEIERLNKIIENDTRDRYPV